jgi:cob(I)alamin adenosyltransferase
MGNRLTKIYTRTGDQGTTGMADGSRIDKDDMLVQAIGDIDELNSQLAVLVCHLPVMFRESVTTIQNELFNVGAELTMGKAMITKEDINWLEHSLDELNQSLSPLKEFILPGGGLAASHCHVARAVCRRAERTLVSLNKGRSINDNLKAYVNRLSDYLFVLSRSISKEAGEDEVYWQSGRITE